MLVRGREINASNLTLLEMFSPKHQYENLHALITHVYDVYVSSLVLLIKVASLKPNKVELCILFH